MQGWGRAIADPTRETVDNLSARIENHRATGTELLAPYVYTILGEAALAAGEFEKCAQALDSAEKILAQTGECWQVAEIHRLRGDLTLARGDTEVDAEQHFETAIAIARTNDARSLELRAAICLARQWQQRGKQREARELLAGLYDRFTEGFESDDLREAKALIEACD